MVMLPEPMQFGRYLDSEPDEICGPHQWIDWTAFGETVRSEVCGLCGMQRELRCKAMEGPEDA